MREVLLKELKRITSEGFADKEEATHILNTFHNKLEEGYSDEEALYICFKIIKTLIK